MANTEQKKRPSAHGPYQRFAKIDGRHEMQKKCPDSFVSYHVRKRTGGKVAFFNFELAKEVGLIPKCHEHLLNEKLNQAILDTFALVIINEFDQLHETKYPQQDVLPNTYMATRYLQLQHPNKQGKTSGDGRSIWNGEIAHQGVRYDISSCGTGATRLSPATHIKGKFFKTGDPEISYGCGYSEIDEGLSTLFFSEVFAKNNYSTERVLAIIEFQKGISINVRVHENLVRPSHLFAHLKQGNYQGLKNIVDYYIDKQEANGRWRDVPKDHSGRYRYFLNKQCEVFGRLAANFEDDYVFCWMDWDGDNILMDGGIIDYGSIRQFGLFHHEYRYDDVQRYSTSIKEQKDKARYTVQTFIQMADFLIRGKKRSLNFFKRNKVLRDFNNIFSEQKNINILKKMGLAEKERTYLLEHERKLVEKFRDSFSYFERSKSRRGLEKVADGINWSAVFCMRDILRELPQIYLSRGQYVKRSEFIDIAKSSYATKADLKPFFYRNQKIDQFQKQYFEIVAAAEKINKKSFIDNLLAITMRSSVINKYDRVTGDSITTIVDKVLKMRPKIRNEQLFQIVREFVEHQSFDPDSKRPFCPNGKGQSQLMKGVLKIVRFYREGL